MEEKEENEEIGGERSLKVWEKEKKKRRKKKSEEEGDLSLGNGKIGEKIR